MANRRRWRLTPLIVVALLDATVSLAHHHNNSVTTAAGRVRHVFIIVLENKSFEDTFGASTQDPYLQKTLVPMGALLEQYYGTGHASLDNYISMISGMAPTPDTVNDCVTALTDSVGNYNNVVQAGVTEGGQIIATGGCIYPAGVRTLADHLTVAGFTWKAYMEDMGNDPARESGSCGHPEVGIGTDNTNTAEAPSAAVPGGDAYATRHNPFVYFHSIIDLPICQTNVINLDHLGADLSTKSTTPNLVFITPNLCNDGHDGDGIGTKGAGCANGEPGGLTSADAFLRTWVPRILDSSAYKEDGLLIITFDEGNFIVNESRNASPGQVTAEIVFPGRACCDQRPGPNLRGVRPVKTTLLNTPSRVERLVIEGFGGDRIGALLVSPFVRRGSTSHTPYNHYSLLRSLEDIFGLHGHLGYAADDPRTGYFLDTIGNDRKVFKHDLRHDATQFRTPRS